MSLSERLAGWAAGLRFADLPAEVVAAVRLRVLDIAGCMLAGTETPEAASAWQTARDIFPGTDGVAPGFGAGLNQAGAALVNGTAGLVLEFDDSHLESTVHVGSPVVGAALSPAVARRLDGRALITAVAAGMELACRLGIVAPGRMTPLGFHPTGIFGTFGAVYAVAKALDLDARDIVQAVGIGGSLAAASMASWQDGTAVKSLHAGLAAQAGVLAVSLARNGITGPPLLFDGRFGFFRAHVQDGALPGLAAASEHLGERWEVLNIAPKAYPCGHYIQPLVDATLAILRERGMPPDAIDGITCTLPDYVVPMVAAPEAEKRRPNTPFHARMSLQHALAEAVLHGGLDRSSFAPENLRHPAINAMADRVGFAADPALGDRRRLGGTVRLRWRDGQTAEHTVPDMRGMPQNPMSEADLVAKFHGNAAGRIAGAVADAFVEQVLRLDAVAEVGPVFAPLCRPMAVG